MQFVRKFYDADPGQGGGGGAAGRSQGPKINYVTKEDISNAQALNEVLEEMKNTLRGIAAELGTKLKEGFEDLGQSAQSVGKSIKDELAKELKDASRLTDRLKTQNSSISRGLTTTAKVEAQIEATKQRQANITDLLNEAVKEGFITEEEKLKVEEDITKQLNEQLVILNKQKKVTENMDEMIKGIGSGLKSLGKIPFVGPILSDLIKADKVVEEMTKAAAKGASKWKVQLVGIDQLFKNIGFGLLGLVGGALKFIIDAVLQFNKQTFEAAKNIGVSVQEAGRLQSKFLAIANSSANAGLMAKDLVKTYAELSDQLGFMAPSNREFAETATLIQKRIGASAEQMGALAMQSALSGKTLSKTYQIIQATRVIEGARNKIALTQRQILDGIAKVSSGVAINFKGNVAAIAAAVVQATKLGTSLDQVAKQGESLLDFESSISKEFEAQVLTGRDLNLTRARELALNNDTVGLMKELNAQGVNYETFMKQNAIQRKAEAEAIGMSVEELSKKLMLQKQAEQLGAAEGQSLTDRYNQLVKQGKTQEEIAGMIGASEAADLRRASIAEKFEAAMQRFKDILGSMLMGPVGGMLEAFAKFVGDTKKMTELATFLKKIFDGIAGALKNLPAIMSAAVTVAKVLATISIVRAVASIVGSLAAVPIAGAAAGLIAGAAAYSWLNGLMSGGGGAPPTPTAGSIQGSGAAGAATSAPVAQADKKMTEPPSTAVATAKNQANLAAGPTPGSQPEQNITFVAKLDGEVLTKNTFRNSGKVYAEKMA